MPTLLSAILCWKLFVFLFCFLCKETRKVFLLCEAISEDISCPEDATLSCQLIYIIFITKIVNKSCTGILVWRFCIFLICVVVWLLFLSPSTRNFLFIFLYIHNSVLVFHVLTLTKKQLQCLLELHN